MDVFKNQTLFKHLNENHQAFILVEAQKHRFTFQELREICETARDLEQWGGEPLSRWWGNEETKPKKLRFKDLRARIQALKGSPKHYPAQPHAKPEKPRLQFQTVARPDKNIFGLCPVYSEETLCCNLKTIDVVENCGFGCNYCTIQTFYGEKVTFNAGLSEKLKNIPLDPNTFYHIGTGQSSDSLMWGNREGILDDLCGFAQGHPQILLEFKTKSANVSYFLETAVPKNVVISWSLNTQRVIENEEHFTAPLEKRLRAARKVADRGIPVAFHFHPMIYYEGWEEEYAALAEEVMRNFSSGEVAFISMGSVTLIKPVMKAIRKRERQTKILQMPMVKDPKGKWTYPDAIKVEMFKTLYNTFSSFHPEVFFYLCMEKPDIWKQTFGFVYPDNRAFEANFKKRVVGQGGRR